MNITTGINNIKLKKFYGKDNKNLLQSQEIINKKEKNYKETNTSSLF